MTSSEWQESYRSIKASWSTTLLTPNSSIKENKEEPVLQRHIFWCLVPIKNTRDMPRPSKMKSTNYSRSRTTNSGRLQIQPSWKKFIRWEITLTRPSNTCSPRNPKPCKKFKMRVNTSDSSYSTRLEGQSWWTISQAEKTSLMSANNMLTTWAKTLKNGINSYNFTAIWTMPGRRKMRRTKESNS